QAEDGIRDFHVTGVQTCALPISAHDACGWFSIGHPKTRLPLPTPLPILRTACPASPPRGRQDDDPIDERTPFERTRRPRRRHAQIGRASCRERESATSWSASGWW